MSLHHIEYMFSVGFRCNSTETLKAWGLRQMSSPFDYILIDIESAFQLIHQKMNIFLKDIVVFNKDKRKRYSIKALNQLNGKDVCYMGHDYNKLDLRINSNFIGDTLSGNMYDWERICIFIHHNICIKNESDIIQKRVDRFNRIIQKSSEKTCLFHITKILTIPDILGYMNNVIRLKKKYCIHTYIIVIICSDNLEDTSYFLENILFIVKKVDSYDIQIKKAQPTDNNLDYTNELNIIKQHFNFQLISLDKVPTG